MQGRESRPTVCGRQSKTYLSFVMRTPIVSNSIIFGSMLIICITTVKKYIYLLDSLIIKNFNRSRIHVNHYISLQNYLLIFECRIPYHVALLVLHYVLLCFFLVYCE